jgi:hypothetical protein
MPGEISGHEHFFIMPKKLIIAGFLFLAAATMFAMDLEVGAIGGGGLVFASGSLMDSKASQLAELGAASLSTAGSSTAALFPGWSAGGYAEMGFSQWFAVRVEAHLSFQGASRLALTDTGLPLDRYGIYFFSAVLPVLARGQLPLWGGDATLSAGPFLGVVTGPVSLVDRYAGSTLTASVSQSFFKGIYMGLAGGLGYSHAVGPGNLSVEARAEWCLTSATAQDGELGGTAYPLSVSMVVGYGFHIPTGKK